MTCRCLPGHACHHRPTTWPSGAPIDQYEYRAAMQRTLGSPKWPGAILWLGIIIIIANLMVGR